MKVCSRGHKYVGPGSCPICWPAGAVKAYIARAPKETRSSKSAIHFPLDKKLPVTLVKKLIRARIKRNAAKR